MPAHRVTLDIDHLTPEGAQALIEHLHAFMDPVDDLVVLTVLSSPDGACWVHAVHSFWDGDDAVEAEALWQHADE